MANSAARKEQIKAHLSITSEIDLGQSPKPVDPRKQRVMEHVRRTTG